MMIRVVNVISVIGVKDGLILKVKFYGCIPLPTF